MTEYAPRPQADKFHFLLLTADENDVQLRLECKAPAGEPCRQTVGCDCPPGAHTTACAEQYPTGPPLVMTEECRVIADMTDVDSGDITAVRGRGETSIPIELGRDPDIAFGEGWTWRPLPYSQLLAIHTALTFRQACNLVPGPEHKVYRAGVIRDMLLGNAGRFEAWLAADADPVGNVKPADTP